jgi:hypothetical protein
VHDPGKIVLDLAVMLAVGGDCPADVVALRGQPGLFGPVASDPTVSRLVEVLAAERAGGAGPRCAAHGRRRDQALGQLPADWTERDEAGLAKIIVEAGYRSGEPYRGQCQPAVSTADSGRRTAGLGGEPISVSTVLARLAR